MYTGCHGQVGAGQVAYRLNRMSMAGYEDDLALEFHAFAIGFCEVSA